jgi:uncharacterized membrane protein
MIQFTYHPPLWTLLAAAAVLALSFWLSYRSAKGRPSPALRLFLVTLRLLAIIAVVLCLLDPQWVEMIRHQQKSRVAVLVDTSRSMSIRDVPGTRLDSAKAWIKEKMLPVVPSGVSISTYAFDQSLTPLPVLDSASPTGSVTALSETLEKVLNLPGEDPLLGVFLVSDGIDNADRDPERVARLYRRKGVPIHTLTVGTTNDMQDIILENVQVKRAVPNEAPTRVALTIRSPGFSDKTVSVQVRSQKDVLVTREVTLNGGVQKVELDLTPRQKGFQIYEAVIPPMEGEWLTSNNRRKFGLEVVDPTIHVLYMEGTPQQPASPQPEWKYLKDALQSDPNIKVTTLYREFGSKGQHLNTIDVDPETGEKIYPVEHPTHGFPRTLPGLLEYDVVIHSDIKKESFTSQQLDNIARLVEQYGGGFVMIGGNSAFGKGGYHQTILDRIIPVAMETDNDSQNLPVRLKVPRAAWTHPILNIGSTPEETQAIWTRKFPTLYGFNRVDRAKPGAIVLAENPSYQSPYGTGVLLAVQEIGKGRSMAFTSDTTRTWGRDFETIWGEPRQGGMMSEANSDSRYYRQFWVNAIRWLATGKMGRTNNPVTLELAQSQSLPNEAIAAKIKVRDTDLKEVSNAQVALVLSTPGKTNVTVRAQYDASTRSYTADVRAPSAGTFTVTAIADRGGVRLGDDKQLLVSESADIEMTDVRARPEFMAKLAKDSNGESFTLTGPSTVSPAYAFAKAPAPTIEYRRTAVWDKALWLTAILGLLATEWAVRRKKGLA